jgi:putative ABC transport system permease protein
LATKTMREIDASIGDWVRIAGPGGHNRYHVVGRVVMPLFAPSGNNDVELQAVADGAVFTAKGLQPLTDADATSVRLVLRWAPGADLNAARGRFADLPGRLTPPLGPLVPLEVDRLEQLHALPWLLGGFLALIGVLSVGYGVLASVRERRRDLAVLQTLGFRRRQVAATVAVQATAFGVIGLAIGVPLGLVVGTAAWDAVADNAGLTGGVPVPILAIAVGSALALVVVNVVAWIPARHAARVRPAVVLRSE